MGRAPLLVGGFSLVAAAISAVAGVTLLWPNSPLDVIWRMRSDDVHEQMLALGWPGGAGLLLLTAVELAVSVGSFQQRRWAWVVAVVALAGNGLSDAVRIAMGGIVEGIAGAVIAALLLWWLARPATRRQFARSGGE